MTDVSNTLTLSDSSLKVVVDIMTDHGNRFLPLVFRVDIHQSKFAKGPFHNAMSALTLQTDFQIFGTSMLEISWDMLFSSFILFPLAIFPGWIVLVGTHLP